MCEDFMEHYNDETIMKKFNDRSLLSIFLSNKSEVIKKDRQIQTNQFQDKIYFLRKGIVEITELDNMIYLVGSGNFLNLNGGILADNGADTSVRVIERAELLVFDRYEALYHLLGMQEGYIYLFYQERKKNEYLKKNCLLLKRKGIERLLGMLDLLAQNFGELQSDGYLLPRGITLRFLEDYTHLSRSSVKKFMGQLKLEGKVSVIENRFLIKN